MTFQPINLAPAIDIVDEHSLSNKVHGSCSFHKSWHGNDFTAPECLSTSAVEVGEHMLIERFKES